MARAQMEIFGIVIIIILLLMGLLFMLRFSAQGDTREDISKQVRNKEIASNFINTFLDTRTNCKSLDIEDLVRDCAEYPPANGATVSSCSTGGSLVCEPGVCSCSKVGNFANAIRAETLGTWKLGYELKIDYPHSSDYFTQDGREGPAALCPKGSDPAVYAVPTSAEPVIITLRICE